MGSIFKKFFQILFFASLALILYQNIISIPANHLGLLIDKTTGLQNEFLKPGYHWLTTSFVPGKWRIIPFKIKSDSTHIVINRPLQFNNLIDATGKMNIEIELMLRYELTESSIRYFWTEWDYDYKRIHTHIRDKVKNLLLYRLTELYQNKNDLLSLQIKLQKYFEPNGNFQKEWNETFEAEGVLLTRFDPLRISIPDYDEYELLTSNITKLVNSYQNSMMTELDARVALKNRELTDQADIEKAEKFMHLIEKNPDIIKYYQIEKLNPKASVIINGISNDNIVQQNLPAPAPQQSSAPLKTTPPKSEKPAIAPEERGKAPPIGKSAINSP